MEDALSDEVYEKLVYSGHKHTSFGLYQEIKDRLIICNGYSKSHAMTGWRLGYAIGAHDVIAKMNKLQQHINTNTCTFIQVGACSIYKNEPVHIAPYVAELEERINYFDTANVYQYGSSEEITGKLDVAVFRQQTMAVLCRQTATRLRVKYALFNFRK